MIAIIIPFHDKSVTRTLESLSRCKEISGCEIALVSDGVPSNDLEFIESYKDIIDIKIIKEDKCGQIGHLRNLGVLATKAEILYFVDSDCSVDINALAHIIEAMPNDVLVRGKNIFVGRNWISKLDAELRNERYLSRPNYAYCPNLIMPRSIFESLGCFNPARKYGSDGDFAKKAHEKGLTVNYSNMIVVHHDCTDSLKGVVLKWIRLGENRYFRFRDEDVKHIFQTYFPDPYNINNGTKYNTVVLISSLCRAIGITRGWIKGRLIRT